MKGVYRDFRSFEIHLPEMGMPHLWLSGICSGKLLTVKARSERAAIRLAVAAEKAKKAKR